MRHALYAGLMAALLVPGPALAQHWITRERCTVTDVRVDPAALPDAQLAQLRAAAADVPNGTGNYWRITAPNGAVSHLWGTYHSNDPQMLDLPDMVEGHVRSARVAAFEINPVLPTRRAADNARSPRDFWNTRGGTLARLDLPDDIAEWVNGRLISMGWGDGTADYMTPGALTETMLGDPCNDFAAGVYPIQDSFLQTLAAAEGAEILGLEDLYALRRKLNQTRHRDLARDIIQLYGLALSPMGTAAERATAFALYEQGEHAAARLWERALMARVIGADSAAQVQISVDSYLLDERNAGFVRTALPELAEGGVFIGVGAWHLQGPLGMVARLRDAGLQVTRVPLARERPVP